MAEGYAVRRIHLRRQDSDASTQCVVSIYCGRRIPQISDIVVGAVSMTTVLVGMGLERGVFPSRDILWIGLNMTLMVAMLSRVLRNLYAMGNIDDRRTVIAYVLILFIGVGLLIFGPSLWRTFAT